MAFNFNPASILSPEQPKQVDIDKIVEAIEADRCDYSVYEDLVDPADLAKDKQEVADQKRKIALKDKRAIAEGKNTTERIQKAKAFEAFVVHQVSRLHWFGEGLLSPTKEADDISNARVDNILEIPKHDQPSRYLGIGVDVTFNTTQDLVSKKLEDVESAIEQGKLAQVKYFQKEDGTLGIELPKVILALDQQKVDLLLDHWRNGETALLERTPIQVQVLLQIKMQLEAFAKTAWAYLHEDVEQAYREALEEINAILEDKAELVLKYQNKIEQDELYQMIRRFADKLKKAAPGIREEEIEKKVDRELAEEGELWT
jgi:hypothetical protein